MTNNPKMGKVAYGNAKKKQEKYSKKKELRNDLENHNDIYINIAWLGLPTALQVSMQERISIPIESFNNQEKTEYYATKTDYTLCVYKPRIIGI